MREKQGPHDSRISQLRAKIVAKRVASQIKGQRDTGSVDFLTHDQIKAMTTADRIVNLGTRQGYVTPWITTSAEKRP